MNRRARGVLTLFCFSTSLLNCQTPVSREEAVVRIMYAKLAMLAQLEPVSKAAVDTYFNSPLDEKRLTQQINDATVDFELSNIKVGQLDEILNEPWSNFFTLAAAPEQTLDVQVTTQTFKDGKQPMVTWQTAAAKWLPARPE